MLRLGEDANNDTHGGLFEIVEQLEDNRFGLGLGSGGFLAYRPEKTKIRHLKSLEVNLVIDFTEYYHQIRCYFSG